MWAQIEKGLIVEEQFESTNYDQAGGRLTKFSARATVRPVTLIMQMERVSRQLIINEFKDAQLLSGWWAANPNL